MVALQFLVLPVQVRILVRQPQHSGCAGFRRGLFPFLCFCDCVRQIPLCVFCEQAFEEGLVGDFGGADARADAGPHHVVVALADR